MSLFGSLASSDDDDDHLLTTPRGDFDTAAASNGFCCQLYPQLFGAQDGSSDLASNFAFSPYGVYSALALLLGLVGGRCETEMKNALGVPEGANAPSAWGRLIRRMSQIPRLPIPQANCVFMNIPTAHTQSFRRKIAGTLRNNFNASFVLGVNRLQQVVDGLEGAPGTEGVFCDCESLDASVDLGGVSGINGVCFAAEWKTSFNGPTRAPFIYYKRDSEEDDEGEAMETVEVEGGDEGLDEEEEAGEVDDMDLDLDEDAEAALMAELAALEDDLPGEDDVDSSNDDVRVEDSSLSVPDVGFRKIPNSVLVDMMSRPNCRELYGTHTMSRISFQSLLLPIHVTQVSILFILPETKTDFIGFQTSLLSRIPNLFERIRSTQKKTYMTKIEIPRIMIDCMTPSLCDYLREEKGVRRLFEDRTADFTGAFLRSVRVQVKLASVRQWTKFGVRENGKQPHREVRDPSVRASMKKGGSSSRVSEIDFVCDKPFYCFVLHDRSNVCFVASKIAKPFQFEE